MSSLDGTNTTIENDISLQLAPVGEDGPDFNNLQRAFEKTVADCQPYIDQCRLNYETRYALWANQSADGKKHAREGAKTSPTPWDGASDLRVYLVDNIINKKVAMVKMAIAKANIVANPIEGNDVKRAREVTCFMKWLVKTQMPEVEREIELLANYIYEKGAGVMGTFWETKQEKTLAIVLLSEFQAQYPNIDIQGILDSGEQNDNLKAVFEEIFGCSKAKAGKMIRELKNTGKTTVAVLGKEKSRPVIRAFNLDNDLFIPPATTDLENAPGIYRVQYFSAEQLRAFVKSDGWDENWVEAAIKTCKGQLLNITGTENTQPVSRSFVYNQQQHRFTDMIGVVYAYQRLSDEDGVSGIYLTIFNPKLPASQIPGEKHDGYAKYTLYSDAGGDYPFILFRREYLSRKIHDSRGLPEPVKPLQDQIKAHKDSRIDAASIAVIPPLCYPLGRPPTSWGPGSRIPERRPNEYHYADRPQPDMNTDDSEDRLKNNANEYVGFASRDSDPQISPMENQSEADAFLTGMAKVYDRVWRLYKRFGRPEIAFRVIGLKQADPMLFTKGEEDEEFAFYLTYDVQSSDFEQMSQKYTAIVQLCTTLDREGIVDFSELLQWGLEGIDPTAAERILRPASIGTQQVINDEQNNFAKLAAGVNVNMKPGTPPQIAQQALQNWVQGAPDVQQRLAADKDFKARVEAYAKQISMQIMQQQNAQTGRLGAQMPGQVIGS